MNLPPMQGRLNQSGFFLYAAADSLYFDRFGKPLINSVLRNTNHGVHVHLYDPNPDQLEFCQNKDRVSVSWEMILTNQFNSTIESWSRPDLPEPQQSRRNKMLGLKQFNNTDLSLWIRKTYYACMRFVRLAELLNEPRAFLEIDIDGLVRSNFATELPGGYDFYLYQKEKGGHLAGAILYTMQQQSLNFIKDLALTIENEIRKDNVYWFLDQHSLDQIIVKYNRGLLPKSYIDWHMQPGSAIWSAKGKRKELEIFRQELQRYQ